MQAIAEGRMFINGIRFKEEGENVSFYETRESMKKQRGESSLGTW